MTDQSELVERVARALIDCRFAGEDIPTDDLPTTDYDRALARAAIAAMGGDRLSELEADNARLRDALRKIADSPTGGVGCNPASFVEIARAALEDRP